MGTSVTETYNVTSIDGTPSTVKITITGTNDAAVITGAKTGSVTEDASPNTTTGDLNSTDVDNSPNDAWNAVVAAAASAGGYGTYTIDATGHWVYALNNANATVNALNNGQTLADSFVVTTADGTSQSVAITIVGHSDQVAANIKFVAGTGEFPSGQSTSIDSVGTFVAYDASGLAINGATFTSTAPANLGLSVSADGTLSASSFNNSTATNFTITSGTYSETVHFETGGNASGGDTLTGTDANIDILLGLGGTDTLSGKDNDDTLFGGNSNDTLFGGAGDDYLSGGDGADLLNGGTGADVMRGGAGADSFIWLTAAESKSTVGGVTSYDTVTDFSHAEGDKLDVSGIDANSNVVGDQAFTIYTDGLAHANGIWFTTSGGVTTVFGDTDGNATTVEFQIQLTNLATPLVSGDFIP